MSDNTNLTDPAKSGGNENFESVGTEHAVSTQVDRHKIGSRWGSRFSTYGTLFDAMEDLSLWTDTSGLSEADTSRYLSGSQSMKITDNGDGNIVIERGGLSLDLTNKRLAIRAWVEDSTRDHVSVRLLLDDSTGTTGEMRNYYRGTDESHYGWRWIDCGLSDDAADLSDIASIRIHDFGANSETTIWIDQIVIVDAPSTAKLAIGFDDGNDDDYTKAAPVLAKYGYAATTYVNTDDIGNTARMSWDQVESLRDDYGWEIGSHLPTHSRITENSTEDEYRQSIEGAVKTLQSRGYHRGARHLAYPYNEMDQRAFEIAQEYHYTARVSGWNSFGYPLNPHQLPSSVGDDGWTSISDEMNRLFTHGGVGILFFHSSEIAESDLDTIMANIHAEDEAGNVDVVMMDDLARSLATWHSEV